MKDNPQSGSARRSRKKRVFYGYRSQNPKKQAGRSVASLVLFFASLIFLLAFLLLLWNPLTPRDLASWLAGPPELHEEKASSGHQDSAPRSHAPRSLQRTVVTDFSLLPSDGGVFELSALRRLDRDTLGMRRAALFQEFSALGSAFADEYLNQTITPAEDLRGAVLTPELRPLPDQWLGALPPEPFGFGPSTRRVPGFSGGPTGGIGTPMGFNPGRPVGEDPEGGVDRPSEEPTPPVTSGDPPAGAPLVVVPEAASWIYLAWGSLCLAALSFSRRS